MIVKPMKDYVLVAENKRKQETDSGIIIEGVSNADSRSGTVLAVGPKVTEVKVGDVVYLDWSKSQVVTIDGAQRVMVKIENIVAVHEDYKR
jgi:co-chaperonin GroES (HSP10)